MCGITGFTGYSDALPILLSGLRSLEYRGYDSAGVTLVDQAGLHTQKEKGRVDQLEELLVDGLHQQTGIGHTRWATHGVPSQLNSHPHTNQDDTISIVHNGIIENYESIKAALIEKGVEFQSQTDSEVIVHLIDYYYQDDLKEAIVKALRYLEGSFAICVVSTKHPGEIYTAKHQSPMIIGKGSDGSYCASDIPAILDYTKDVVILEDGQIAHLTKDSVEVFDFDGNPLEFEVTHIPYDAEAAQKGGFDTYMMKEIHEQPNAILETLRGRLDKDVDIHIFDKMDVNQIDRIYFLACGTAYHAGLYAQALLQQYCDLPIFCLAASEFRYGNYAMNEKTMCIFITQSGETADTLAALTLAKEKGAHCLAVTNVLGSSISRKADDTLYTCAGPEIAVASTKAYTTQLVLLSLMVIKFLDKKGIEIKDKERLLQDLNRMPEIVDHVLDQKEVMEGYAKLLEDQYDAYFIGRQMDYVSVLEGALKLKEVSYVHADAYMAGELKHGSIALIEKDTVVIALATQPEVASKTISNIEETIARGARVILITTKEQPATSFEHVIRLEDIHPMLSCIPVTVYLQLLAYYTAKIKGCDVDKPRNLAKSVTVE